MIELAEVQFAYESSREGGFTLRAPSLSLPAGSRTAVVGPSGSGKTTLLHLIAGILTPPRKNGGTVTVEGRSLGTMSDAARRRFRLKHMGLVFQQIELLDYLDVRDNILLPYRLGGGLRLDRAARQHTQELAERVGLAGKLGRPIARLSQGERQRVAICRALVAGPKLLLADEPTSALDADTAGSTMDCMTALADAYGATLVVLTHDPALLPRFERVVRVGDGTVAGDGGGAASAVSAGDAADPTDPPGPHA